MDPSSFFHYIGWYEPKSHRGKSIDPQTLQTYVNNHICICTHLNRKLKDFVKKKNLSEMIND